MDKDLEKILSIVRKRFPISAGIIIGIILVFLITNRTTVGEALFEFSFFIGFAFGRYLSFDWFELTLGQALFMIITIGLLIRFSINFFLNTKNKEFEARESDYEFNKKHKRKKPIEESFTVKNRRRDRRHCIVFIILLFSFMVIHPFVGFIDAIFNLPAKWSDLEYLIQFIFILIFTPIGIYLQNQHGKDMQDFIGTDSYYMVKKINERIKKREDEHE